MKKKLHLALLIGSAITLASCEESTEQITMDATPIVIVDDSVFFALPQANISVEKGEIREEKIWLDILFLGGCEEHEFGLMAPQSYYETNPPTIPVQITQNARDDTCKNNISKELLFDMAPLREYYQGKGWLSGIFLIQLSNLTETLIYEF